jgi:hypothetical protein
VSSKSQIRAWRGGRRLSPTESTPGMVLVPSVEAMARSLGGSRGGARRNRPSLHSTSPRAVQQARFPGNTTKV